MHLRSPRDLPGNTHTTDPGRPARVTGADRYRVTWTHVIADDDPARPGLMKFLPPQHRPSGTTGIIGLESQEHALTWVGAVDIASRAEAEQYNPDWGTLMRNGVVAEFWPMTDEWDRLIPDVAWHSAGHGVIAGYPVPGGEIVVYERPGHPAMIPSGHRHPGPGELVPVVTWHCTACHEYGQPEDKYLSCHPRERQLAAAMARRHAAPGRCQATTENPENDRMVSAVREAFGGDGRGATYASFCATRATGPAAIRDKPSCAEVREARAHGTAARAGTRS
jgi:hypothetical protein